MTFESQNESSYDDLDYTQTKPLVTQKVTNEQAGVRLDKFLVDNFKDYSRNQLIRLIENEAVCLNGTGNVLTDADYKVKAGEQYTLTPVRAVEADPLTPRRGQLARHAGECVAFSLQRVFVGHRRR